MSLFVSNSFASNKEGLGVGRPWQHPNDYSGDIGKDFLDKRIGR